MIKNKYIDDYLNQNKSNLQKAGVYHLINEKGEVIYVGKAKNLFNRLSNYKKLSIDKNDKIIALIKHVRSIKVTICNDEYQAFLTEIDHINSMSPKYNTLLKDDKSFPYIAINKNADFPSLRKFRGKMDLDNNVYFGPFIKSKMADETIFNMRKIFKIRSCNDNLFKICAKNNKPCMDYYIKKCSAPCVGFIEQKKYNEDVQNAVDFLSGNSEKYIDKLKSEMLNFAEQTNYIQAKKIKDQIDFISNKNIKTYNSSYTLNASYNFDIINYHFENEYCFFYILYIRNLKNYGGRSVCVNLKYNLELESFNNMRSFLLQFYSINPIPSEIIIPEKFQDIQLTKKYFKSMTKDFKNFYVPKQKDQAYDLIKQSKDNAIQSAKEFFNNKNLFQKNIEEISRVLSISDLKKIYIFDNSHLSGSDAIGASIAVDKSGFVYSDYRKIKFPKKEINNDDYLMMKKIVEFRLKFLEEKKENYNEVLFIIDGGQGHLSAVQDLLSNKCVIEKIKFICISKGENRNSGINKIHYLLDKEINHSSFSHDANLFLQKIRDESHRYAITGHRKERVKKDNSSILDSVKGLKKAEKMTLLSCFGSVHNIKQAGVEKIMNVIPRVSKKIAQNVIDAIN